MAEGQNGYWVPECVRAYLRAAGYSTRALEDMEPHVREWDRWMRAVGEFYDYRDTDGFGRVYQVHRRTIMPAMRVCREWGSLLLDERTVVACESQACTDWLGSLLSATNFWGRAQETVVRAFGLGTGAFAVWMDVGRRLVRVRHYDARMVVPLSWDAEGVRECAFVTRCFLRGVLLDQLQMHVVGDDGAYRIRTVCFDGDGREVAVPGVAADVATGSTGPTFGIVRPAVPNTRVDFSPYGQSVFADAVDAVQSVDLAYDALINEIDAGKMRVFLSDVMFDQERTADGRRVPIPFGKGDCTMFRKVMSTEDTIQEFAPALRTEAQGKAFRLALQVLGDLVGLGTNYFDLDNVGYASLVRTDAARVYDLPDPLSELADAVGLTRATLVRILEESGRMDEFSVDPMTFLSQVTGKIEAAKNQVMAKGIKYTRLPEKDWYTMDILAVGDLRAYLNQNAWKPLHHKSLYNYVVYDSSSIEQPYAVALDRSEQVKVFAKLPSKFKIDTPLGSYNPDWAYVEEAEDGKQRVYFVVETKGKQRGENRPTEEAKISCAEAHFKALELGSDFHYEVETEYHYATV